MKRLARVQKLSLSEGFYSTALSWFDNVAVLDERRLFVHFAIITAKGFVRRSIPRWTCLRERAPQPPINNEFLSREQFVALR